MELGAWEWFAIAIGIVAAIAVVCLAGVLIKFLFGNWIISKSLSAICSIVAFICAFSLNSDRSGNPAIWPTIICVTLAYLFAMGDIIFEPDYGFEIFDLSLDHIDFGWRETGGFLANLAGSFGFTCFLYFVVSMIIPPILFIIPVATFILNLVFVVKGWDDFF